MSLSRRRHGISAALLPDPHPGLRGVQPAFGCLHGLSTVAKVSESISGIILRLPFILARAFSCHWRATTRGMHQSQESRVGIPFWPCLSWAFPCPQDSENRLQNAERRAAFPHRPRSHTQTWVLTLPKWMHSTVSAIPDLIPLLRVGFSLLQVRPSGYKAKSPKKWQPLRHVFWGEIQFQLNRAFMNAEL